MSKRPDNPSAFPAAAAILNGSNGDYWSTMSDGMTLRDYFAAKAMQGFMANKSNPMRFDPDNDAKWAYMIADAMLAAREK